MFTLKKGIVPPIPAALALVLLASGLRAQSGATLTKGDFEFINAADTTSQRFTGFGSMPAINDAGAVAFKASGPSFPKGGVFLRDGNGITTIASSADGIPRFFGESLAIAPSGAVAFSATNGTIATGRGGTTQTIVNAQQQGIIGGQFLAVGGMTNSRTVVFSAIRQGFASQAIFAGDGGPLATLVDTKTSAFTRLGNVDINASGTIVFRAFLADGTEGLFSGVNGATAVTAGRFPSFTEFLDPVINDAGAVGSAALLGGSAQVFTSKGGQITPRNPASPLFSFADNVSINNAEHVAFSADSATGETTIYIETTRGASPIPVVAPGDFLFGSTVTLLALGTHSLNDDDQIAFQYILADGRSGIAIASPKR
jgi:hypothetical protein